MYASKRLDIVKDSPEYASLDVDAFSMKGTTSSKF